jgi:hypothetical protein
MTKETKTTFLERDVMVGLLDLERRLHCLEEHVEVVALLPLCRRSLSRLTPNPSAEVLSLPWRRQDGHASPDLTTNGREK